MQRDDPDYYAVQLMNTVLGGGGFTSRITNRVRSDEGLAYSAGSSFGAGTYYPEPFIARFQSKLRTCSYASQIVLEEIKKVRDGGITADELATAKKQLTETLPRRFATKAQTVSTLAAEEFTGRYQKDPDYFQHYRERMEAVKADDISRVAKKWLDPQAVTILVVGKKEDLLNPDPRHPVGFASLSNGKLTELPLRDPLTMKPLPLQGPAK
jgi:predicted Zn-dependent peptidase